MLRASIALLVALLALAPGLMRGAEKWSRLKLGMTADETMATLGQPTLRTTGRGFEVWIYDNGAEVLLFGSLIGWPAPTSTVIVARSVDVWQISRNAPYCPTFLARIPQPASTRWIPRSDDGWSRKNGGGNWAPFYLARR